MYVYRYISSSCVQFLMVNLSSFQGECHFLPKRKMVVEAKTCLRSIWVDGSEIQGSLVEVGWQF